MKKWVPTRDYTLRESSNDGTLKFQRGDEAGSWKTVKAGDREAVLARERARVDAYNNFIGSIRGKTVVIFGTGPQLKRITGEQIKFLKETGEVAFVGVNSMPKWCKLVWGLDPAEIFDFIVGADLVKQDIHEVWGWSLLGDVPRFQKWPKFIPPKMPIMSCTSASDRPNPVYYVDSITAAINLSLIGMASHVNEKLCVGPYHDWPERRAVKAEDGIVILVGVEHNRHDHAYTDDKRFWCCDRPHQEWPNMRFKIAGHEKLRVHAQNYGSLILNAAPWSMITNYSFCDFEQMLEIPAEMRTGVTSDGMPEPVQRARSIDEDKAYIRARAEHREAPALAGYVAV